MAIPAPPADPAELASFVEVLLADVVELRRQLRTLRLQHTVTSTAYGDLLAAALATLAAVETDRPDPFAALRDELPEHPCITHSTTRTARTETPRGTGDHAASTRFGPALAPVIDIRRTVA